MKIHIKKICDIFLPIILGSIIGIIISKSIDYQTLSLPPLAPPSILFPIAWTIIYLLMGFSFYLFKKKEENTHISLLYYIQLLVNLTWSLLFFLLKWRLLSIFWIILLDILVICLLKMFYLQNKISTYLNIPYLLWILFATYLTIGIYILN